MNKSRFSVLFAIAALIGMSAAASAQEVGQHPAVYAPRELPSVNPSTFIVAPPAAVTWTAIPHANHEHPAVTSRRDGVHLDTNAYLVQPPAHVEWLEAQATTNALALVR